MRFILITLFFMIGFSTLAQDIKIGEVSNKIVIGDLAGSRSLTFGVKNILEEVLQDAGLDLNPNSNNRLDVEILFFDVQKNAMQVAVFGKNLEIYQLIAKGIYTQDGKKPRVKIVKGTAKSISTSTLIIDQGGKFSQANVSTAMKKLCVELIEKLKL